MAQYTGFVKSYNEAKGWGFIECPQTQALYGKDIFVLRSALQGGGQGDQVMFGVVDNGRGPQATNVVVLGSARPAVAAGGLNGSMGYGGGCGNGHAASRPAPTTVYSQGPGSMLGTVKSYNAEKGWGFITSPEVVQMLGKDVFFMKSSVIGGFVEPNQQVSFSVVTGNKGMQAEAVQPLGNSMSTPSVSSIPSMPSMLSMPPTLAPPPAHMGGMPMQMMMRPVQTALPAPDQLFFGAVKGYNEEKGWGHISCEAAKNMFGKEVFLLKSTLGGQTVEPGALLGFKVCMAPKGPQAQDVKVLPPASFEYEGQPGRRYQGTVKLFNAEKGWGFVTSEEVKSLFFGKDIFLRRPALQDPNGLPQPGQEASFSIEVADHGKLQAKEVVLEGPGLGQQANPQVFAAVRPSMGMARAAPF